MATNQCEGIMSKTKARRIIRELTKATVDMLKRQMADLPADKQAQVNAEMAIIQQAVAVLCK